MRKAITGMVAFGVLAVLLLTSVPPASASPSVMTSFVIVAGWYDNGEGWNVSDRVIMSSYTLHLEFQGDWNGRATYDCRGFGLVPEFGISHCKGTFEGSILGNSGTAKTNFFEWANWDYTRINDRETVGSGTGGLAGIHGVQDHFTVDPSTGAWTSYWRIHFE